jgi:alcohol dehydrogenase class IV
MMKFTLTMPGKIAFGRGELANVPQYASGYGKRFLIAANPPLLTNGIVPRLVDILERAGLEAVVYGGVTGEPSPAMVQEAADRAVECGCDGFIGIGGGSAMDAAKAAAGIATNGGPVVDYLEGVGTGRAMTKAPLPFIAIPTTSGTGAEATKNAVISDAVAGYKFSFRSDWLLAKAAVIDPELTLGVPQNVTAWSGMDALTQLMEAFISKKSQPVTDALAISGIRSVAAGLLRAYVDGGDIEAREAMAYGSFLSGICLANAGLGADHGLAAAFGAVEGTPHGLACAVLLPYVMELNMPHTGAKAVLLSEALTGRAWDGLDDNVKAVTGYINVLARKLGIPSRLGLKDTGNDRMARIYSAISRSSMLGNPIDLGREDIMALIRLVV